MCFLFLILILFLVTLCCNRTLSKNDSIFITASTVLSCSIFSNNCLPSNDEARILGAYNLSPRPSISDKPSDTDDDDL